MRRVHASWRFTFSGSVAHHSVGAGDCSSGAEDLTIHLPPAALYKQTGRCEVTTAFIAIALFCCQKFDHSRSLFIALIRSTAVGFTSSQEEELQEN
jgi:hypothetical protein